MENECFWTVVLENTLESPLNSKEIKSVNSKGNQPWIFIERTDAGAEALVFWPPDVKSWLTEKDPDAGKNWGQKGEGGDRGWDGWMASLTHWIWVWANLEIVMDRETWYAAVHGVKRVQHNLVTEQQQKIMWHFYTLQWTIREIKEITPFAVSSKRIKHLKINLIKEVKTYTQKIITHWWKKLKMIDRWRDILCSWIGRINIGKMTVLHKTIYKFSVIPIKIPMEFFTEREQLHLKFVWKQRRLGIIKSSLRKKEQNWIYHSSWLQVILQSYNNQNSMELIQEQTHKSME